MNTQLVLNGRYELGELIGRGGMADVHRGTDTLLGRTVAIKLLRADLARDPQFQARFKREAQAVAGLNHPSIVAVYDTGEYSVTGPGENVRVPYIVMEYVAGRTLRDLIKARELGIGHAIDFTLGVLAALEYSHKAGIVHRDIKPANVMVTGDDDGVKVMDFGIARAMADSAATMTQTQAVVGTAQYLSPEQARGETVDARSDLYSAACMLYEMLTGRPPFVGDSPVSVAYQHVREVPEPPSSLNPEVSEALDTVLAKALQKNRDDRFQDAAAFRRALRAARNGVPLPALPLTEAPTDPNDIPPRAATSGVDDATAAMTFPATAFMDEPHAGLRLAEDKTDGSLAERYADQNGEDRLPLDLPRERERSPRQKSRRRAWVVTLVIFTLLTLAGGGFWLYNIMNQKPLPVAQIQVPSVTELTESQALQKLYDANFKPEINRLPHDKIPKGIAIGTVPGVGTSMAPASEITLNISNGPSSVTIPADLPGRTEAAVRDVLRQSGLVGAPTTSMANSSTVPAGMVITTNPAPGETVPIGSTVEIVVSTGKVPVPQLAGLLVQEAETLLKDKGLGIAVVEAVNTQVQPGKITAQSDAADSLVEQGKVITVTVAKAPPPSPSPTPTPNPSTTKVKGEGAFDDLFG